MAAKHTTSAQRLMGGVVIVSVIAWTFAQHKGMTDGLPGGTLSEMVWAASAASSLVPFGFGLLMGHWFWPKDNK
jgi:hypothetical protein